MTTKRDIEAFVARLEKESNADPFFKDRPLSLPSLQFFVTYGKKYARVISGGSAWGFIDLATGDILKAASWSRPAKHARGNIATAQYGEHYTWTGPRYLR